MVSGWTSFATPIGVCGIAWTRRGIAGVWLPERTPDVLDARLTARLQLPRTTDPPAVVGEAMDGIVDLLGGAPRDLCEVVIDLADVPDFHRRVYDVARAIPPGQTLTYGDVAARLGVAGAARAVGQALGSNPVPIVVPCHRVVAAGNRPGGFSAPGGLATKRDLLAIEMGQRQLL